MHADPYRWSFATLLPLTLDEDGEPEHFGPYDKRRRGGHCLYCNLTLMAALLAMGHACRWCNISAIETFGHEVGFAVVLFLIYCIKLHRARAQSIKFVQVQSRYVKFKGNPAFFHLQVIELYSNEWGRWIFFDATRDYYTFDPDTLAPLSLREMQVGAKSTAAGS